MKKLIFLLLLVISIYSFGQSVDGGLKTLTASGTDTYTITEALPAAYDPKERFIVSFANPNTITTPTLNRAALGAKFIKNADGTNPSVGAITGRVLLSYNGTYYQIVGGGGSAGGGSGTVTNVAALTLGTTGTDLSSSVANPTTTPVITLNVPTASGSNRGALSASDWSTFNGKQATGLSYLLASGGTATGTNTFAMGAFPFIMTTGVTTGTGATAGHQLVGNSLTTGNLFDASSSSVSTGALGVFTSTSTVIDHTAGTNGLVEVLMSGANSTASKTAIGLYSKVTNTGTTNTNIAGYFEASGGTTNLALRTLGNVFIANASGDTPTASTRLDVRGTGTTTNNILRLGNSSNDQIFRVTDNGNTYITSPSTTGDLNLFTAGSTARLYNNVAGGEIQLRAASFITFKNLSNATGVTINLSTVEGTRAFILDAFGSALAFGTQKQSSVLEFQNKMWDGGAEVVGSYKWKVTPSLSDQTSNLILTATNGTATAVNTITFSDTGNTILGGGTTASELRFLEPSGSGTNYLGFKVPALAGNLDFTWFDAYPAVNGYVLSATTAGVMSWIAPGGGGSGLTYAESKALIYKK